MRILHIAPFNTAGVPYTLVKAERGLGHDSRLITFARHPFGYPEDICLDLPFIKTPFISVVKKLFQPRKSGSAEEMCKYPPEKNISAVENLLLSIREFFWHKGIKDLDKSINLNSFDIYRLDGGMCFFRDGRFIKRWKKSGKTVTALYLGSDLRVRGVFNEVSINSDLNFTVEYDHLDLYPGIEHIPFPFDFDEFDYSADHSKEKIIIGHAPTNRRLKRTGLIVGILEELKNEYDFQVSLIENMSHENALKKKRECALFIDQISDLGYGINAVESMAMGIPTFSSLTPEFCKRYPDNPIVEITPENLKNVLVKYIADPSLRVSQGRKSAEWARKIHDSKKVAEYMLTKIVEKKSRN